MIRRDKNPSKPRPLLTSRQQEATGDFFGWEDSRVVVVTGGGQIMELITRAKTHLAVILVGGYETKEHFLQAADRGLVEMVLN